MTDEAGRQRWLEWAKSKKARPAEEVKEPRALASPEDEPSLLGANLAAVRADNRMRDRDEGELGLLLLAG